MTLGTRWGSLGALRRIKHGQTAHTIWRNTAILGVGEDVSESGILSTDYKIPLYIIYPLKYLHFLGIRWGAEELRVFVQKFEHANIQYWSVF